MISANREGFSLLEVLMATSILLGSVIVLNQLAGIGRKNALAAQDLSTAQMLCQTRLNEILAGTAPAAAVDEEPVPGAPGWVFNVSIEPIDPALTIDGANLAALELTVSREEPDRNDRSRYTLVRWIENSSQDRPANTVTKHANRSPDRRTTGGP
jgi:Tfp pilus assembly protein PilV